MGRSASLSDRIGDTACYFELFVSSASIDDWMDENQLYV